MRCDARRPAVEAIADSQTRAREVAVELEVPGGADRRRRRSRAWPSARAWPSPRRSRSARGARPATQVGRRRDPRSRLATSSAARRASSARPSSSVRFVVATPTAARARRGAGRSCRRSASAGAPPSRRSARTRSARRRRRPPRRPRRARARARRSRALAHSAPGPAKPTPPLPAASVEPTAHDLTPTWTLRNRAGDAPCETCACWPGWPLPQFVSPYITHSSGPATRSSEPQKTGVTPV